MEMQEFDAWLVSLKTSIEGCDVDAFLDLFADELLYRESPFSAPLKDKPALREAMQKVMPLREDVAFGYEVISVSGDGGWAHFELQFTRQGTDDPVRIDGILQARFRSASCIELNQWQERLEPGQGDLMRDFDA